MNDKQENKYFYQIKKIKKFSDNINIKLSKNNKFDKHISIQRKKSNLLIPMNISNESRNRPLLQPTKTNISTDVKDEKLIINKNIYKNILKQNNFIEDNILLERPKVKIKMNSLKHNNTNKNTVSSKKSNNQIKCKVHKLKPENSKYINKKFDNLSKSNIKTKQSNLSKINYGIIDLNKNVLDLKEKINELIKKDKSYINYYNIIQEKSLDKLSKHLDNLIGEKLQSKSEYPDNNEKNESIKKNSHFNHIDSVKSEKKLNLKNDVKINDYDTNVYRKKIQRKINVYPKINTFPDNNFLTFEHNSTINNDKEEILKTEQCNKTNKNKNKIKPNKTHNFITNRNNNLNKKYINEKTNLNNYINNSILMSTFSFKKNKKTKLNANISRNHLSELISKNELNDFDNIKGENLVFNNNETFKDNIYNYIEVIKPEIKYENYSSKKSNYTKIRTKNNYNFDILKNNVIVNRSNLEDITNYSKNDNSFNYKFLGNNENNNLNLYKNNNALYSNNSSQFNTVNTLNNSEKNILKIPYHKKNDKKNNKSNENETINYNNNSLIKKINFTSKKINMKSDDLLNGQNITPHNSINKKLKNVVTSIEYYNRNYKEPNYELKDKNIILSEVDQNGKINIKVKEMKNSIEKILRDNSFKKTKKSNCRNSPQKFNLLTYVKKNQGTYLKKIQNLNNNTVSHNNYYRPTILFQ